MLSHVHHRIERPLGPPYYLLTSLLRSKLSPSETRVSVKSELSYDSATVKGTVCNRLNCMMCIYGKDIIPVI